MLLLWIAVIIAFVGIVQLLDRVRRLEQTAEDLRHTIERLTKRLDAGTAPVAGRAPAPAPKPVARYERRPSAPPPPPIEEEIVEEEEPVEEVPLESLDPALLAGLAPLPPPPVTQKPPAPPTQALVPKNPPAVRRGRVTPPPPRPPPARPRPAAPEPARPRRSFDW